jgi:hypothetical protein
LNVRKSDRKEEEEEEGNVRGDGLKGLTSTNPLELSVLSLHM